MSDPVESPAARHARIAERFTERVTGAEGSWDAPAPVEGWVARDVVRHLLTWFPAFLNAGTGIVLDPGPAVDQDPAGAWRAQCEAIQALLEQPGIGDRLLRNPHIGEVPVDQAVDRFYVSDVFMHTWDLARATGQDERLDEATCRELYHGMLPMEDLLRSSGQYGPRVDVPEDSDVQTRLLGFIGRRP